VSRSTESASRTPWQDASASTRSASAWTPDHRITGSPDHRITGSPVSKDYTAPFAYTGTIDRIEFEIGEAGLDSEEEAKLHARFTAGKEY
jgi:hypothetical protein